MLVNLESILFSLVQAREFANELRASTKAPKNSPVWLEGSSGSGPNGSSADTSTVSDAYSKMLTIFIPLLVDEVICLLNITT
jgi:exocyst complex component 1